MKLTLAHNGVLLIKSLPLFNLIVLNEDIFEASL